MHHIPLQVRLYKVSVPAGDKITTRRVLETEDGVISDWCFYSAPLCISVMVTGLDRAGIQLTADKSESVDAIERFLRFKAVRPYQEVPGSGEIFHFNIFPPTTFPTHKNTKRSAK